MSPARTSLFSLFAAGLACLAPFASAYTQPVGAEPKGNPISEPGLNSIVPAGENYTVTWQPTTPGTVTLVLLKGPSTNIIPQYAIAEKIDNTGSFVWKPSTDLAPQDTGYGIQLIVDSDGQYQYTTQFGISNPDYKKPVSSSSASSSSSSAAASTSSSWAKHSSWTGAWTTSTKSATTSASNSASTSASANATMSSGVLYTTKTVSTATGGAVTGTGAPSGYLPNNGTIVQPTGSMTVPVSLQTSASVASVTSASATVYNTPSASASSVAPAHTNAAAEMATSFAGLVVAAGVAVFAL